MVKGYAFGADKARILSRMADERSGRPPGAPGRGVPPVRPQAGLALLNDAGEDIPAYSLVVADSFEDGDGDYFAAKVKKPYTTFRQHLLIAGPQDIEDDKRGFMPAQQYYRVKYDSGTPAFGEQWGVKPGQYTASKGFPGLHVLGVVDATDKILLARLDSPITTLLGKTTGAITNGSASTSYRIYAGGTLGSEADAGFTTVPSALSLVDIDSGLWITLTWLANGWRMEPLECNA